ncbi:Aste57867_21445 [Aphanomyces stellatus]|uniref:Aste57867_21445 protein n=1 Tax=Aphanomyces stellatus TaxID=120398 RepID=A0A485LHK2_9STRA|nr:hypothetical protein As57867_021376 [Aphanomyces stellatus]VFT98116.1 Aste57867_21445 [Aphanomyces stellatus]
MVVAAPLGPARLPQECMHHVAAYLDHPSLHNMELTSHEVRQCFEQAEPWKVSVLRGAVVPRRGKLIATWKHFACACAKMDTQTHESLLQDVVEASSVDRADAESPSNTLHVSQCYREMMRFKDDSTRQVLFDYTIQRLMCGCSSGQCYWSSAPASSKAHDDFIDFSFVKGPCLLQSLQIVPYKAFWQLGAPGYAPLQLSISIRLSKSRKAPYYTSPRYSVANMMETFHLPHKVLVLPGSLLRIHLMGKQQFEYEMSTAGQPRRYYCCVSYLGAAGVPFDLNGEINHTDSSAFQFNQRNMTDLHRRLPAECILAVVGFLDHESLHAMELTSRTMFDTTANGEVWKQSVLRTVLVPTADDDRYISSWKHFACASDIMDKENNIALLKDTVGVSSVHRDDAEPASNTLHLSQCYRVTTMLKQEEHNHILNEHNIQRLICDCSNGDCYWSSAPTDSNASNDFIAYSLLGTCILRTIEVIPYKAFWQMGAPGYAPQRVSLSIFETTRSKTPCYVSPEYEVVNNMELQVFSLPHKVLARDGAIVRVNLLGKQQFEYETEMENQLPRYYCCMSYIGASGVFYNAL